MKPRIFIAMHYMEIGGAESSLIGLLEALDPKKVDIDLFIFAHHGVFMNAIPKYANLLPEDSGYSMMEAPIATVFKKGHPLVGIARLIAKWKTSRFYKNHPEEKDGSVGFAYIGKEVGMVLHNLYDLGEYNLAISYNYPHNIVLDKVKAKKKMAWLHTDYRNISINKELELPIWSRYDHIVSISLDVTIGFLLKFPTLADKILEMENILPKSYIEERADAEVPVESYKQEGVLTLCSIGRISYAKNYDNIPRMAAELKRLLAENKPKTENTLQQKINPLGSVATSYPSEIACKYLSSAGQSTSTVCNANSSSTEVKYNKYYSSTNFQLLSLNPHPSFIWYIIGPGNHSEIDKLSEELGVKDSVVFLGPSDNPYPFIKNCDIYVHPSRFEGKSIVVREAQVLCKPVIITNYPTAKSQIKDGVDGVICGMDNKEVAEAIHSIACDKHKQAEIVRYLLNNDFTGVNEVNKIYSLL